MTAEETSAFLVALSHSDLARIFLDGPDTPTALCEVEISDLLEHWNPLDGEPWGCPPIVASEVWAAVEADHFETDSWQVFEEDAAPRGRQAKDWHIRRLAWLIIHRAEDPIVIEPIGHETLTVQDGNHRLAVATILSEPTVQVLVRVSDLRQLFRLLPSLRGIGPEPSAEPGP